MHTLLRNLTPSHVELLICCVLACCCVQTAYKAGDGGRAKELSNQVNTGNDRVLRCIK
jgi:hypothetical protein